MIKLIVKKYFKNKKNKEKLIVKNYFKRKENKDKPIVTNYAKSKENIIKLKAKRRKKNINYLYDIET